MMTVRALKVLGIDVSDKVVSLGEITEAKDLLLSRGELFTGEASVDLDNSAGAFSLHGFGLFKGNAWYNADFQVLRDGKILFQGFIKSVETGAAGSKTMTVTAQNILSRASDRRVNIVANNSNPAGVALQALNGVGLLEYVDVPSFITAGQAAADAGAVISVDTSEDGSTAQELLSSISDVCSISFVAHGDTIRAQAWRRYQGSGAGCRQALTDDTVISFSSLMMDQEGFANEVVFMYGADLSLSVQDSDSMKRDRGLRSCTVEATTSSTIKVGTAAGATFFAQQILERSAFKRFVLEAVVGPDFPDCKVGDRHLVTSAVHGLTAAAFEVIECSYSLSADETTLRLVSLPEP